MSPNDSFRQFHRHLIELNTIRRTPVIVGTGIVSELDRLFDFSGYSAIILVTDSNVARLYGDQTIKTLEATGKPVMPFTLPAGERAKSLRVAERGYRFLVENRVDRRALLCALGGGVVGDAGGFIAATYLRGLDFLQLPTTLLAQVDSSIGGKVAVNFGGKKNMVGSFYQPRAVIADVAFLESLPPAEMRNGLAEVAKYGIAMDEELFAQLEQMAGGDIGTVALADIVMRCAALKAEIVEADETERSGQREILNFGHTVGHALEAVDRLKRRRHGEAVAVGMTAAARVSRELGMLDEGSLYRIERLLAGLGLPNSCPGVNPDEVVAAASYDKKTALGETRWVLLERIGRGVTNQRVAEPQLRKILGEICR